MTSRTRPLPATAGTLQRGVDDLLGVSAQRWLLGAVSVIAAVAAFVAGSIAGDRWWLPGIVIVAVLAVVSAVRPDEHVAVVVVIAVAVNWLVCVDDLDTLWLPVTAVVLCVYHAAIALVALVPTGGTIPIAVLVRWSVRTAMVAAATVAMWMLVVVLDRRDLPGHGALTALALLIVATSAIAIRFRSIGRALVVPVERTTKR